MVDQVAPLEPVEDCRGIFTLLPVENPMQEHVDILWKRPPARTDFLVGIGALGWPTLDQSVPGGPYPVVVNPY